MHSTLNNLLSCGSRCEHSTRAPNMISQLLAAFTATTLLIILSIFIMRRQRTSHTLRAVSKCDQLGSISSFPESTMLSKKLASALPDSVVLPHDAATFEQLMNSYWAQQECEVIPACFVRPRNIQQLSTAINAIKREYDGQREQIGLRRAEGLFAVRSGGHSPVAGAASIKGGVVIDLRLFAEVTPSEDGSSVVIGTGAKWMDVSKILDKKGLAVVGGRSSAVGVGGLTLGGKPLLFTAFLANLCHFNDDLDA